MYVLQKPNVFQYYELKKIAWYLLPFSAGHYTEEDLGFFQTRKLWIDFAIKEYWI